MRSLRIFRPLGRWSLLLCLFLLSACASGGGGNRSLSDSQQPSQPHVFAPASSLSGNYLAARHGQISGNRTMAARYMTAASNLEPENEALLTSAFFLALTSGNLDDSITLAYRLEALGLAANSTRTLLFADALKFGDLEAARAYLDSMEDEGVHVIMAPLLEAWLHYAEGAPDFAIARLEQARDELGFPALYNLHAGMAAELSGQPEKASEFYEAALAGGVSLRGIQIIASHLSRSDDPARALALMQGMRNEVASMGMMDLDILKIEEGQPLMPFVYTPAEAVAEGLLDVANALGREHAAEAALLYGHIAEYLNPDLDFLHFMMAHNLSEGGHMAEALRHLRAIGPDSGFSRNARLREALLLEGQGQIDQVILLLRDLTAHYPNHADAWELLGDIYRGEEHYRAAIRAYDSAIALLGAAHPTHWSLYYKRAIAHERSGDWPPAEADLLYALELDPNQPLALNYLGYVWADRGEHVTEAMQLIELAVALRPDDGYLIDSLGWVYYRIGHFDEAVAYLEEATALVPDDPEINDHLGDAYWQVGRRREARFQWLRAMHRAEAENMPDRAAEISEKLDHGMAPPQIHQIELPEEAAQDIPLEEEEGMEPPLSLEGNEGGEGT